MKDKHTMTVTVRIPTPLRKVTNGEDKASVEGGTMTEVVESLEQQFPGLKDRICEPTGELRSFVNVYINGEDVRFVNGMESNVNSGDEVSIVPAVAGGCLP
jgi:molybdopterin synthase sulfur carrier subunit